MAKKNMCFHLLVAGANELYFPRNFSGKLKIPHLCRPVEADWTGSEMSCRWTKTSDLSVKLQLHLEGLQSVILALHMVMFWKYLLEVTNSKKGNCQDLEFYVYVLYFKKVQFENLEAAQVQLRTFFLHMWSIQPFTGLDGSTLLCSGLCKRLWLLCFTQFSSDWAHSHGNYVSKRCSLT